MNDVYFKASLQNTLNPEVGTFDNVRNKEGTFTLEDGEYYLTNNTSSSYGTYYPTKDIYSVGFTIEFDINYTYSSSFKWLLLFNGDDSTSWHGFGLRSSLVYEGQSFPDYVLIASPNTWLHVKCIFDYSLNQNFVHIYIDNVEVNNFTISKIYDIKYIDILGNSGSYVPDAKIKNIIIYNSSKKHYLDTIGLTSLWSKIKSLFATKTELTNGLAEKSDISHTHSDLATKTELTNELAAKANDNAVVHTSGDETVKGAKTFTSNPIVENTNPLLLIKNSNVNKGTNPSTSVYSGLWLNDKNGIASKNRVAGLGCEINTAGKYRSYLCVYKPLENDTTYSQISISYSSDGIITTSTPTPPASDNSNQIANTSWCRANLVTKDSTQTITGSKTFSNGIAFDDTRDAVTLWKKIKADKGEVLTTDQSFEFLLSDNTGNINWVNRLACIRMWYSKDTGNTNASIGVFNSKDNTQSTNSQISIQYDKANNKYITSAPTPPINDNSTQIATTSFVNTTIKNQVSELVNSAPETLDTLNELANALGNDPNFATTVVNQISNKANDADVVHKTGNETVKGVKTFTKDNSNAAIALTHGSFKKGDASDVRVACLYTGDGTSYANSLNVYDVGTNDSGNITATSITSIENTAGVSGASKRTSLQIIYHKNPTDRRKQYATLSGDFLPSAANTYNLGSESNPWARLYCKVARFTDNAMRKITGYTQGGTISSDFIGGEYQIVDENDKAMGAVATYFWKNGYNDTYLTVYNQDPNNRKNGRIGVAYNTKKDFFFGFCPTPPKADNGNAIATTEWSRSNFITLDTNQTIATTKSWDYGFNFTNKNPVSSIWKQSQADKGTNPTTQQSTELCLADSTGNHNWVNRLGYFRLVWETNGDSKAIMSAFNTSNNTTQDNATMGISYVKESNKYVTHAPTPPADDNSTQIATTAWVTTKDSNAVHKTGNETISGQKTINQPLIFNNTTTSYAYLGSLRTVAFAKGDDITGYYNQYNGFTIVTANTNSRNENRFITVDGSVSSNGDTQVGMHAFSTKAGSSFASIRVDYNRANDVFTTYAPTPPANDNSTQIATTKWVNSTSPQLIMCYGSAINVSNGTIGGGGCFPTYQTENGFMSDTNTNLGSGTYKIVSSYPSYIGSGSASSKYYFFVRKIA